MATDLDMAGHTSYVGFPRFINQKEAIDKRFIYKRLSCVLSSVLDFGSKNDTPPNAAKSTK
jgi:predicted patatin/cPLA2 family phospholipase